MTNPISSKVRGWFYVIAVVVGSLSASVSAALLVLGVDVRWQAVVAIFLGGAMSTLGMLARNNLTLDPAAPTTPAAPVVAPAPTAPAPAPVAASDPSTSTSEAPATGGA